MPQQESTGEMTNEQLFYIHKKRAYRKLSWISIRVNECLKNFVPRAAFSKVSEPEKSC